MSAPGRKAPNMLPSKSREQLLIAPERIRQLGQSRKNAPLWISPVVKVKSKAVYCHPAYLTYMQITSGEMLSWMNHKLE